MIRITDQYFWNFIFSLFFIGVVTMGVIILDSEAYKTIADLTLVEVALLVLATQRLIRLFLHDVITKFFREQFWDAQVSRNKVVLTKPESGPRRTLADLLSCPWCFGMWAAATVTFFYLLTPLAQVPIFILAVAGAGTWVQQLAAVTGYKAQRLKEEVER